MKRRYLMLQSGVVADAGGRLVQYREDLAGYALTGLALAGQIEHRGIGTAADRVRADDVGVVDRRFGLDPAHHVDGALVAGRAAEPHDE